MKEFFQLNGYLFSKETNFKLAINEIYGWNHNFLKLIYDRFENFSSESISLYEDSDWRKFKSIINTFAPQERNLKDRYDYNIFLLDFLNTYRGLRHCKGLPVRGQRTWTNAWSVYRSNLSLRNFKLEIARRIYGNIDTNNLSTIFLAEQINYIWKLQWQQEWVQARNKRLILMQDEHNAFKIDLNAMSKGYIDGYERKKEMSKKKKALLKKNVFTLGFEPGFALFYLKPNNSISTEEREKVKIIFSEEVVRHKIIQKKKPDKKVDKQGKKEKKKNTNWI